MRILPCLPALAVAACLALCGGATAQTQSQVDQIVHDRLMVSEFLRLCVATGADPKRVDGLLFEGRWRKAAASDIAIGLNRRPPAEADVYEVNRSRGTSRGRERVALRLVVPVPGVRDCTLQFEDATFAGARQGLDRSGYTREGDAEDPTRARTQWVQLCEDKGRRPGKCVELAVDPARYPLTGQLTLTDAGPEPRPDARASGEE